MKELLTISELAKLTNTSTHQLRYFEEKGILNPTREENSEYRLYGERELYKLAHILFLRKFDISVSKIKECFESYGRDEYLDLLKVKVSEIEEKIEELIKLKDFTKSVIGDVEEVEEKVGKFHMKSLEKRTLTEFARCKYNEKYSVKDFYKDFKGELDLYQKDTINLYDDENCYLCLEETGNEDKIEHVLHKGDYLTRVFLLSGEEKVKNEIASFFGYAYKHNLQLCGKLIIIEYSNISLVENHRNYYEIQGRIK